MGTIVESQSRDKESSGREGFVRAFTVFKKAFGRVTQTDGVNNYFGMPSPCRSKALQNSTIRI